MSRPDPPNRRIVASGQFKPMANHSNAHFENSGNDAKLMKFSDLTNLNDETFPRKVQESNDEALRSALKNAGYDLSGPPGIARDEWQKLPTLRPLSPIAHRTGKNLSSGPLLETSRHPDDSDALGHGPIDSLIREVLRENDRWSDSTPDIDPESQASHFTNTSSLLTNVASFESSDSTTPPTRDSLQEIRLDGLAPPDRFPNSSFPAANDIARDLGVSHVHAATDSSLPVGRSLTNWTQFFADEPRDSPGGASPREGERSTVQSGSNDAENPYTIDSPPRISIGGDRLASMRFNGVDPKTQPSLTGVFNSLSSSDVESATSEASGLGLGLSSFYSTQSFLSHDLGSPSSDGRASSNESPIDLSKTNELLQQLIEEVRKGRQGFLPIHDRNSMF